MAEKTSPGPSVAITPLQQMLASGTGAILTSLFGEALGRWGGGGEDRVVVWDMADGGGVAANRVMLLQ